MAYLDELFGVKDKTIFITGAASGLGRHCTKLFFKLGSNVIFSDINGGELTATEKQLNTDANKHLKLQLDVTDEKAVKKAVNTGIHTFGKIDVLLNCAAIIEYKSWEKVTVEDWNACYKVDLLGSWLMSKAVAESMIEKKVEGSIINVSSSLCHRTQKDLIPYNSIKAAVAHMTRSLGLELSPHKIRVNGLAPGMMKTEMVAEFLQTDAGRNVVKSTPFKRSAELTEMDGIILLLASNASTYMTGAMINIDGGLSCNEIMISEN